MSLRKGVRRQVRKRRASKARREALVNEQFLSLVGRIPGEGELDRLAAQI